MEAALLDTARARRRDRLRPPHRALPPPAARALLPDARLAFTTPRTRCRRRAARVARRSTASRGAARCKSWLYTIATNTCLNQIEKRPKRVLPVDYAPAADPHGGPGRAVVGVGVGGALSRRADRGRGRLGRPGGALRAARERGARVRRGAPAPAREPARRADPARGARLLGPGGRRDARHDRRLGEQRAAARAQGGRGARCRSRASRRPCASSATSGVREIVERYVEAWERTTSTPSWRCSPTTRASRCRRSRRGSAARSRSGSSWRAGRSPGAWRWRPLPARANGQPALAFYIWDEDEQGLPAVRAERAHVPRRADQRRDRLRHARHRHPGRRVLRALARRVDRPRAALRHLRELRPPGAADR